MPKIPIIYATMSKYKQEEVGHICQTTSIRYNDNGKIRTSLVGDLFDFQFRKFTGTEILECDLVEMVKHKAIEAYKEHQVPCIVEHAGLLFDGLINQNYPGGLTQPMWDAIGDNKFIEHAHAISKDAIARAVIGYCNGMDVKTFVGETKGTISAAPSGSRGFYWDTVFCPNGMGGKTYADICDDPSLGIPKKVELSQSAKALLEFLEYRLSAQDGYLFDNGML